MEPAVTAFVYKLKDADGITLYAGKSVRVPRLIDHQNNKEWFSEVASIEIVQTTLADVDRVEVEIIVSERPKYNIVHNRAPRSGRRQRLGGSLPAQAADWLVEFLREMGGTARATEVRQAAMEFGFSLDTLKLGKKLAGVQSIKSLNYDSEWSWQLPPTTQS